MASPVITLEGLPSTIRRLETLPPKIQRRAMKKAINAGAAPFLKASRRNAPRATGLFKRSLTTKVVSYRSGAVTLAMIGQQKRKRIKATAAGERRRVGRGGISGRGDIVPIHFIEEDIRSHAINPKQGRSLRIDGEYRAHVRHPGVRGQHPIAKAARESESAGVRAFAAKLQSEVIKEAAKLTA